MVWLILITAVLMILYARWIGLYKHAWEHLTIFNASVDQSSTSVTVIIPVRNESAHLSRLFESLQQQQYPRELIEIIFVDDASTDDSLELMNSFASSFSRTHVMSLPELSSTEIAHKKRAIHLAIQNASGKLIVTTDGDCTMHPEWISMLVSFHEQTGAGFIAAPVKIKTTSSWVSIFQTLDFITLQGITGAAVSSGSHVMCNGANLAYEKKIFEAVNGFEGIDGIASGDDMLLMQKVFTKYPEKISYIKHPLAVVTTAPVETWRGFFHQRIRWASKATHYKDPDIFKVMITVYLLNVSLLIVAISSFFSPVGAMFFSLFFVAKILIEFPFVSSVTTFFNQRKLMRYFPLMQIIHIPYTVISGMFGQLGSFQWKGRTIKTTLK